MKIFVFGDSIVQGRCDDECFGWVNRFAAYMQKRAFETNWKKAHLVFNLGSAGDTSQDVKDRFLNELHARRPEKDCMIIFGVGINDAAISEGTKQHRVSIEDSRKNFSELFEQAQKEVQNIYVLGLTMVDESKTNNSDFEYPSSQRWKNDDIVAYDDMIQQEAQNCGIPYLKMSDLLTPELLYEGIPPNYDGIHPNAEGHRLIFERVKSVLEQENIL